MRYHGKNKEHGKVQYLVVHTPSSDASSHLTNMSGLLLLDLQEQEKRLQHVRKKEILRYTERRALNLLRTEGQRIQRTT